MLNLTMRVGAYIPHSWLDSNAQVHLPTVSSLVKFLCLFYRRLSSVLWSTIDNEIHLEDCNVYSYNPDLMSDPYGNEGSLWSFNFFFYNQKLKRILFFTCQAISHANSEDTGALKDNSMVSFDTFESSFVH